MELKTARLTLLIDPHKKAAFERLCAQQDRTPSQVVRQLIRDYLARFGLLPVARHYQPDQRLMRLCFTAERPCGTAA